MERTTLWTSAGGWMSSEERVALRWELREERGETVKLPDKGRVWKRTWLSSSRRGEERRGDGRWILLLSAFWCFSNNFFFFSSSSSLLPPPPSLSLCCLYRRPSGLQQSASQLVSSARAAHDFPWLLLLFVPQFTLPSGEMCSWCVAGRERGGNWAKTSKSLPAFP